MRHDFSLAKTRRLPLALAAAAFIVFFVSFQQTWLGMIHTWYSSRTFSHCFLIVPFFVYLVWLRRDRLAAAVERPCLKAVVLLYFLGLLWLAGKLADARIVQEFVFVAMLIAMVWVIFGVAVVKVLRFPLAFLFFAVPFGVSFIGPLQDFTAWFTVHALTLTHIPAILESRIISLPSGVWTVAEACSGIRYLFSSVVLGTFFASIIYGSTKRRILLIVASAVVPILANGVRAYLIVLMAYVTDNKIAAGVDHIVYGGLFFVTIQTVLLGVAIRWREAVPAGQLPAAEPSPLTPDLATTIPRRTLVAVAVAAMACCLLVRLLAVYLWDRSTVNATWSAPTVASVGSWKPSASDDATWAPAWPDANQFYRQTYTSREAQVNLRCALFTGDRSVPLVDSYNLFTGPKLWSSVTDKTIMATINGQPTPVRQTVFSGSTIRVVWTLYWVSGEYTTSATRLKLLQAKARLLGKPALVVVIVIGADTLNGDVAATSQLLQEFVRDTSIPPPT